MGASENEAAVEPRGSPPLDYPLPISALLFLAPFASFVDNASDQASP